MYTIKEEVFNSILKKIISSLVGKSCKRIEVIRDNSDIPTATKFNLIRDLIKEQDYEAMREISEQIDAFSKGIQCNVNIIKPTH